MKKIACIHTVPGLIDSFAQMLREAIPGEIEIHSLFDSFLLSDPAASGRFTPINHQRLRHIMQAQALTGADLILISCSTLSPSVRLLRSEFNIPVVAIDDAMAAAAVMRGSRIGLIATNGCTVAPSSSALHAAAHAIGKEIDLQVLWNADATTAMKAGDKAAHDRMILEMAEKLRDRDVIVLAQASMAHMEKPVAEATGIPTLSSPALCMEQVRQLLGI